MPNLIKKLKLRILSQEKIKILHIIFITLFITFLTYLILILDPFDLDFFNEKYIADLKSELDDLKQQKKEIIDDNLPTKKEISSEVDTKKTIYYLVGAVILVGILFFYFNNGGDLGIMDDMNNYLPDEDLNPETFKRLFSGETSTSVNPSSTPDVKFIKLEPTPRFWESIFKKQNSIVKWY